MHKNYDIIVIGGGHAGIEAAYAGSAMGCKVGLITMDKYALGRMSCNPAVGGTAKGHLVERLMRSVVLWQTSPIVQEFNLGC